MRGKSPIPARRPWTKAGKETQVGGEPTFGLAVEPKKQRENQTAKNDKPHFSRVRAIASPMRLLKRREAGSSVDSRKVLAGTPLGTAVVSICTMRPLKQNAVYVLTGMAGEHRDDIEVLVVIAPLIRVEVRSGDGAASDYIPRLDGISWRYLVTEAGAKSAV